MKSNLISKSETAQILKSINSQWGIELPKQKNVGREIGMKMQKARLAKKLKQVDVARRLNMQAALYQKYENGTAPRNGSVLNKIGKILGVKLTGKGV